MLELLFLSVVIAVFVNLFVHDLTDEGMVLSFYGRFLDRLPYVFSKPLGGCDLCFGGWLAFIGYFFRSIILESEYSLFIHFSFIFVTLYIIKCLRSKN